MISTIREKLGTRWLNVFVWLALISMSGIFIVGDFFKRTSQQHEWVLKIGRRTLSWPDYASRVEAETRRLDLMREKYGSEALQMLLSSSQGAFSSDPKQNVITNFVQGALFAIAMQKLHLSLDPALVMQEFIERLPAGFLDPQTGKLNRKLFQQTLGLSYAEVEQLALQEQQAELVTNLVEALAYVGQFELERDYLNKHGQKQFAIVSLPTKELVARIMQQPVSDSDLLQFYREQVDSSQRYWEPAIRTGFSWELSPADFAIKIAEKDALLTYNREKQRLYLQQPAQLKIRKIVLHKKAEQTVQDLYLQAKALREKLVQGQTKFSDHQAQESTIVLAQNASNPTEQVALALKQDGEISPVIELGNGETVEIIQRINRRPATYRPFTEVQAQITKELTEQKFRKVAELTLRRMASSSTGLQQFKALAEKRQLKATPISGPASNGTAADLFKIKTVGRIAYENRGSKIVVFALTGITPAHTRKLADIKDTVLQDYREELINRALTTQLEAAKVLYTKSQGDLNAVAQQLGVKVHTTTALARNQLYDDAEIRERRIPIDVLWDLNHVGMVHSYITRGDEFVIGTNGITRADKGGYLIKLVGVKLPAETEKTAEQKQQVARYLQRQRITQWEQGFIASLGRNAKIKTNETLQKASQ